MALWLGASALAQSCEPTPHSDAVRILGQAQDGRLTSEVHPVVHGENNFYQILQNGWVFGLIRSEYGWSIRVFDAIDTRTATDLTASTPPLRGAPNPRDIFGWHFRNMSNTGPNDGGVNAPRALRGFVISPGLSEVSRAADVAQTLEPDLQNGIGWLRIVDYGIDNSATNQRAALKYLQFDACVTWPRSASDTAAILDQQSPNYTSEDVEVFAKCGLDLDRFELSARMLPRSLGGDLDGDGALDEAAQVLRLSDGRHGLAICRAGTWLHLVDLGEAVKHLRRGVVGQTEAWQWLSAGMPRPSHLNGQTLPKANGDYLIIERFEKEAFAIFWTDDKLSAKRLYGHVEP